MVGTYHIFLSLSLSYFDGLLWHFYFKKLIFIQGSELPPVTEAQDETGSTKCQLGLLGLE